MYNRLSYVDDIEARMNFSSLSTLPHGDVRRQNSISSSNRNRDIEEILNFSSLSLDSSSPAEPPANDTTNPSSNEPSQVSSSSSSSAASSRRIHNRRRSGPRRAAVSRCRPVHRSSRRRHFFYRRATVRRNPLSRSSPSSSIRRGSALSRSASHRWRTTDSTGLGAARSWREERAAMNTGRRVQLQR